VLIDDDPDFCFFLKANIEREGNFAVTTCSQSIKALSIIKEVNPDVVLLDVMMPDKSGIDIARELKANKKTSHIPYIFISGIIDIKAAQNDKNLGGAHCLAKPIETEKVIYTLNKVLSQSKQGKGPADTQEKVRTVTFLTREQIDFLDNLGKDALFLQGNKLSRSSILADLVDILMQTDIQLNDSNFSNKNLKQIIIEKIKEIG